MEDTQQSNEKGKGKRKRSGKKKIIRTVEKNNELLQLMVDTTNHGWRDNNGLFSKTIVEKKIRPSLNDKIGCQKTYYEDLSHLKLFKNRYHGYSKLMCHSFGFGWDLGKKKKIHWDPDIKKFTTSNEVWENYFKID